MAQTFNPANVLLSDSIGKDITNEAFTQEFLQQLASTSKVVQLGQRVDMTDRIQRFGGELGELSDAYFVGEGEKIGTAKVEGKDYVLEARKIGVILPVTEEALAYTWSEYFSDVVPLIVDKFNKKIDGAAFLGLHGDVFGSNVLGSATEAGNIINGELGFNNLLDLQMTPEKDPNAFVGHRSLGRSLRLVADDVTGEYLFDRGAKTLDGLPYHELKLSNDVTYPDGTLITGDFNGLKYGIPRGTNLRLRVSGDATLSKVQNTNPDTGDVHLFEQDMQALRAIFEIAVAVPNGQNFAVIQPSETEGV